MTDHRIFAFWTLCLLVLIAPVLQAEEALGPQAHFDAPTSCAALALIRSADYPEAVRVYEEGHEPLSFEEADAAALGLLWRHRRTFAEDEAIRAFAELHGRSPTDAELSDAQSRWVRMLVSYPQPLREAVEQNCEVLFEIADRSCPTPLGVEP
ncbi:MAG: hypothetical protein K9L70_01600 [Thiohalocapsa sp.]|nr:hypothetical protein [Thiohalocapsa sp.]MCF7990914.1 hypothetical protein [Thiohalocapsa sp.]